MGLAWRAGHTQPQKAQWKTRGNAHKRWISFFHSIPLTLYLAANSFFRHRSNREWSISSAARLCSSYLHVPLKRRSVCAQTSSEYNTTSSRGVYRETESPWMFKSNKADAFCHIFWSINKKVLYNFVRLRRCRETFSFFFLEWEPNIVLWVTLKLRCIN